MSKWPDGTPKSTGNAFDWRSKTTPSVMVPRTPSERAEAIHKATKPIPGKPITIGSKKKQAK